MTHSTEPSAADWLLTGRSVYLARPVTTDHQVTLEVSRVYRELAASGAIVYDPTRAFAANCNTAPTAYLTQVNDHALRRADIVVACFPEAGGIRVPMEVALANSLDKPLVIVTDAGSDSWSLAGLNSNHIRILTRLDNDTIRWLDELTLPFPVESGSGRLPVVLDRPELVPVRAYHDDAGFDLITSVETKIEPGRFTDVPCGCAVELPDRVWGMIVGRSSTLRKHQLLVNLGVIDTGWRGPLFAGVWNLGDQPFVATVGMRLAQLIPLPNLAAGLTPTPVEVLSLSERGINGFGSTGI